MAKSLIDGYLLLNALVLAPIGFLLYLKPLFILAFVHSNINKMSPETVAVLHGWGAVVIPLSVMCYLFSSLAPTSSKAKQYAAISLMIGWIAIAHGTWHMIDNTHFGNWDNNAMKFNFFFEVIMALISLYFAAVYKHQSVIPGKSD